MTETLIIALAITGLGYMLAAMRKPPSTRADPPKRVQSFASRREPTVILKAIVHFAQRSGYKVEDIDDSNGRIVLSEAASMTSAGFFYPIFLEPQADGGTLIRIGIKSKLFQVGPIVSRSHDKCVNGMRAALFAEG